MTTPQQQMTTSDFNMDTLNTKELSEHIAATIQIGGALCAFGRRGTGKTEISKQEIKKADMVEVYINLSVMERTDLGGYPDFSSAHSMAEIGKRKFISFMLPRFYEAMMDEDVLAGRKGVVALLDEVDKAEASLWAPLLEFVQFRSINGIKLPFLHAILMTGNLISEGGQRPSPPLLDRCEKYLVTANHEMWLDWAGKLGGIHPSITAFINDNPTALFGAIDPEDRYADPSPRGWHRASDIAFAGERLGWSTEMINKKIRGCVGKDVGIKFQNYYEHYQKLLPLVEDVFAGNNVKERFDALEPGKMLIACMITCARLATKLDQAPEGEPPASIHHVGKFLQIVPYENVLIAVRSQIQIDRLVKFGLDEHPEWSKVLQMINQKVDS